MNNKVTLLVSVCAAVSAPVFSQVSQDVEKLGAKERPPMEHVIVSIPAHQKDARTAMPITVLDGDELNQRAAATLGDTLRQTPGMASASFGPAVGQPVIRGQQGPRVQVLQNSLPSLDVSTNSADHAVSVEPVLADSIEILKGPSTLLYGGGAIGGIVNVLDGRIPSRAINGVKGSTEFRHSSVDDGRTGVFRVDGGNGDWAVHVDGLYRDWSDPDIPGLAINPRNVADIEENSDGFVANADGRTRRFSIGAAHHFDTGYWGLSYSELSNDYGIPAGVHHHDEDHEHEHEHEEDHEEDHDEEGGDHDDHEESAEGIRLNIQQKRWDVAGDLHLSNFWELMRWRMAYSEYEHVEVEPSGETGTRFQRDALAARLELSHQAIGDWHGVVGMQWLDSEFSAEGEEAFVPATDRQNLGLFWLEDYHSKHWQLEMGLRGELDRLSPDAGAFADADIYSVSGSLGALYDVNDFLTLGVSLAQSRRAPTAEERYSNGVNDVDSYVVHGATGLIEVGDENLGREKADSADVSVKLHYQRLQGSLTLFYKAFEDFIYLQNTGQQVDDIEVLSYRQEDADFRGLEYELSYLLWQGAGEVSVSLYGDRVSAELDNGGDIPRLPPQRDGLRLEWRHGALTAGLDWQRAAAQRRAGLSEASTAGYHRMDASVAWRYETVAATYTWSVRGRNLNDELIRSSSSFIRDYAPEAGRSVVLALRVDFGD